MDLSIISKARIPAVLILSFAGLAVNSAQAGSTFTFASTPSGSNSVTSYSYTVGGLTLTASGFYDPGAIGQGGSNSPVNLYYNSTGDGANGDNNPGLGLNNNVLSTNHVIPNNGFIQLQFSSPVSNLIFDVEGVTDYWRVYGSNTAGQTGSTILFNTYPSASGTAGDGSFTIPVGGGYAYYDIISSQDCEALLSSVTATVGTPEPLTLALLGLALGVFGLSHRRSAKAKRDQTSQADFAFRPNPATVISPVSRELNGLSAG